MDNQFSQIVKNLIPENIRNIKLIKDSIDVFLQHIIDNSNIAIDIANIFYENKTALYEEFVKIYLKNMYLVLTDSNYNQQLNAKVTKLYKLAGLKDFKEITISDDVLKILNKDIIFGNKAFKNSKGISTSIEYVYHLIEQLELQQSILRGDGYFRFIEGDEVFEYTIEGSLLQEIYEHFVKPLSHPVGWTYSYNRLYELYFKDYFLVKPVYKFNYFYVGCQCGQSDKKDDYKANLGYLPFTDSDGNNIKQKDGVLIYADNNEKYPFENLEDLMFVANHKDVKLDIPIIRDGNSYDVFPADMNNLVKDNNVIEILQYTSGKDTITEVYFKSGEKLEGHTFPRSLKLLYWNNPDTPLNARGEITIVKKDYDDVLGHCGLNLDYSVEMVTEIVEELAFYEDFGIASSYAKLNAVGGIYCGRFVVGQRYTNNDISVTYANYPRFNRERYSDFLNYKNIDELKGTRNNQFRFIEKIVFFDNKVEILNDSFFLDRNFKIRYNSDDSTTQDLKLINYYKLSLKKQQNIKFEILLDNKVIETFIIKKVKPISKGLDFEIQNTQSNEIYVEEHDFDPKTTGWVYMNPYYYNNTANEISATDYGVEYQYKKTKTGWEYRNNKYTLEKRLVGNQGIIAVDEFSIESISNFNNVTNVEIEFNDLFELPKDLLNNQIDNSAYVGYFYANSGYINNYEDLAIQEITNKGVLDTERE